MGKYIAYPSYKNSEVEWLGNVPEHWKTIRIKFSTYVKGRVGWHGLNSKDFLSVGDYYLVTGTDFKGRNINWETCYRISEDRYEEDAYIHLKDDDILITKDGTIGKIVQVKNIPYKASVNSGVFVTRPLSDDLYYSDFMYYFLNSDVFNQFVDFQKAGSTIHHLYQNTFENFEYCFPANKSEQQQIADFLDEKTAYLDRLIGQKQQMIGLLNEKRMALITQAVTKGLDLTVPTKDSGVEWLGEVPEHWEVKRLKFFAQISNGQDQKQVVDDNGCYPIYGSGGIFGRSNEYLYDQPSVLLGRKGTIDKPLFVTEPFWAVDTMYYTKIYPITFPKFLFYQCLTIQFAMHQYGSALPSMTQESLNGVVFASPDFDEQRQIAQYLDTDTQTIDTMITTVKQAIATLQEYRTALITAAVTGKIDVRGFKLYDG